ncbi:hypothetical protein [Streptomyces sp. LS1784]|uniref:hypothetical protein n=1 Tax=Streptomyces sp. LS1784 TaxID=2851533 RepID=UPI001CCF642E|nr:hypothetical protein [Streptomyces sp. LS1784]
MRRSTLPRTGWAHPYGHAPFSPFLYADGGDGGDSGSNGDATGSETASSGSDAGGSGTEGDGTDSTDDSAKPKPPAKGGAGDDQAAEIARLTKELTDARKQVGKERNDAKATAAQEARTALVQELGRALGLVQDEKDTPPDPAKLTAEIERVTSAHRETAVELAVFRGAATHGADPGALTDSRAFMAQLAKLDPADDKFTAKVGEAIKAAVADNPKLAAAPAKTDSGSTDFNGSTGDKPKSTSSSVEAQREAYRKGRR